MIGWIVAGLLLGFMVGIVYGTRAEHRRMVNEVESAKRRMLEAVKRFQKTLPGAIAKELERDIARAYSPKKPGDPLH